MIESAQNDNFKRLLSLTSSKGLKEHGQFLLSGEKLVQEFLAKPHLKIISEVLTTGHQPVTTSIPQIVLSPALFELLDVVGTHFNILVLEQPQVPILSDMRSYEPKGVELVVPIGDPGNLGALIRSCEAFAVPRVILSREAAHPFLPKSVKASAGSVMRVPLVRGPSLAEFPSSIIALDTEGASIDEFKWPSNGLLVVGEEGSGFESSGFKAQTRIRIPTHGVESLNAVVAASIALSRIPQKL